MSASMNQRKLLILAAHESLDDLELVLDLIGEFVDFGLGFIPCFIKFLIKLLGNLFLKSRCDSKLFLDGWVEEPKAKHLLQRPPKFLGVLLHNHEFFADVNCVHFVQRHEHISIFTHLLKHHHLSLIGAQLFL